MEALLKKIYYDLDSPASYSSAGRVLKEARKTFPKISITDVNHFLEKQFTYTLHKKAVRKFKRLKTIASGLNTDWQADLSVFINLSRVNKGYKYLLVCVDVLSRMVYVEAVKSKTYKDMIPAFTKIFERAKVTPWKLFTDNGTEFNSKTMMDFYERNGVLKYSSISNPVLHATIVERMNRTIKDRLYKYFDNKRTDVWIDVIQKIVAAINHSVCRTTGMRPVDVTYANAQALYERLYEREETTRRAPRFKVGDTVRVEKRKALFTKGLANYTDEIFTVAEVLPNKVPVVYRLDNHQGERMKGYYYEQQLCRASRETGYRIEKVLKKRVVDGKREFFVKWAGFKPIYNSWVSEEDIE